MESKEGRNTGGGKRTRRTIVIVAIIVVLAMVLILALGLGGVLGGDMNIFQGNNGEPPIEAEPPVPEVGEPAPEPPAETAPESDEY